MSFPKPDGASKAFFESLVPKAPGVQSRPMFGNRAAFVNGNMFLALFGAHVARTSTKKAEEWVARSFAWARKLPPKNK